MLTSWLKRYPLVVATLVVGAVGLTLLATPLSGVAPWLVGAYALGIAGWEAVGMVRQLLRGHAGLDILAVTAITAAVLVGEVWAALIVVLMLTGGAALEDYAEHRSKRELTALLRKAPQLATRLVGVTDTYGRQELRDGTQLTQQQTEVIPVEQVQIGDILLVRSGDLVPVDAELLDQHAVFDESSLTGESLPVERLAGERISSGAVNGSVAVTMRAVALAKDSEYHQNMRLVEPAAASKGPIVRLADRYAVPFTLVALAIAGIAWAVSGDPVRFAEVLVVATPCPLLIAAPVAFLGGMSRAARFGLIVKGGGTLEQLSRVRGAAFDKTGTLTSGHPTLERVVTANGFDEQQVLQFAASAEVYSSHVIADSVVQAVKHRGIPLLEVTHAEELATNGVAATLKRPEDGDGVVVRVGKGSWVAKFAQNFERMQLLPGELGVYVSVDDDFVGVIVMRDQVRDDALAALQELRELGVEQMLMITGDIATTAEPIAKGLGIEVVHAECRPADKVRIVGDMSTRPLIMAGDGLNDAPVLAAADIGFAMGARGSTAASESADVVNRFDNLMALPRAVRIGKDTVRIALQSIWLGIIISLGLMLVAAFGFLPAIVGAWMQELVDLIAILGALRAVGPRSEREVRRRPDGPLPPEPLAVSTGALR